MTPPAKERGGRGWPRVWPDSDKPAFYKDDPTPLYVVPDDTDELREIARELESAHAAWNERAHVVADHRIAEVNRRLSTLLSDRGEQR